MNCQYYYQPVLTESGELRMAAPEEKPEMFGVYWRGEDGLSEWVADFLLETDAKKYVNDNNRKTVRIVVEVEGGCLQAIYGDALPEEYQFAFILRDWDNINAGDPDPVEDYKPERYFW